MGAFYELYSDRRANLERELAIYDVEAAADQLTLRLDSLACDFTAALPDRRIAREFGRTVESAKQAARLMLAVSDAEIEKYDEPATTASKWVQWLPSVLCQALAVWLILISQIAPAVCALVAAALCARAAIAGKPRQRSNVRAKPRPDPRQLARLFDLLVRALDAAYEQAALDRAEAGPRREDALVTEGIYSAAQMLIEADRTRDGGYALRAAPQLIDALVRQGIEMVDYSPETAHCFELFPSAGPSRTIRPAMIKDGALVARGQATEGMV